MELGDYGLLSCEEQDEGFDLLFSMQARNGRLMERMLYEVRPRLNLDSWDDAPRPLPETTLGLELRPVARTLGGHELTGFSYRFVYRSESHPIYKNLDRASWEIGGSVARSEFWLRNGTTAPIAPIARFASCECASCEQAYSTE